MSQTPTPISSWSWGDYCRKFRFRICEWPTCHCRPSVRPCGLGCWLGSSSGHLSCLARIEEESHFPKEPMILSGLTIGDATTSTYSHPRPRSSRCWCVDESSNNADVDETWSLHSFDELLVSTFCWCSQNAIIFWSVVF